MAVCQSFAFFFTHALFHYTCHSTVASSAMNTNDEYNLETWVGHPNEKWLFSVMPLDGGGKRLYSTPYEYEMSTRQLIDTESTVEAWHARVHALYQKESHRWPEALPVPPHWDMPVARTVRAERIEQLIHEDRRHQAA